MANRTGRGDVPILEASLMQRTSSVSISSVMAQSEPHEPHGPAASPTQHPSGNTMLQNVATNYSDRIMRAYQDKDALLATEAGRLEELHAYHQSHGAWRFYRTFCQVRFGYLAFLVLIVILMFSFTFLMEIFFAIFLPSAKYDEYYYVRAVVSLVLMPLVLFFLSYFFEEAWRLFLDALNKADGSLPNFRLALAVVIHYLRHRSELAKPEDSSSLETNDTDGQRGSDGPGSGDELRPSRTSTTRHSHVRKSLLLAAKDDPFLDEDKEEEDEAWQRRKEEREAAEQQMNTEARSPRLSAVGEEKPRSGVNLWKRAKTAVKTTLLIKKTQDDGPQIDLSTFVIVDLVCPVLFEVTTVAAVWIKFLSSWSISDAFLAYVQMGFWFVGGYLGLWIVTHFWSSRNGKMRVIVSNYRRRRRMMRRAVSDLERRKRAEHLWLLDVGFRFCHHLGLAVNPMSWCSCIGRRKRDRAKKADKTPAGGLTETRDVTISVDSNGSTTGKDPATETEARPSNAKTAYEIRLQRTREFRAWIYAHNPWVRLSLNLRAVILTVLVIAAGLISIEKFFVGWPIMGICLIALSSVVQKRFPQIFGRAFRQFITSFVVISLVFFSSSLVIGTFSSGGSFKLGTFDNTTELVTNAFNTTHGIDASITLNGKVITFDDTSEYAACSIDYDGLSVLDLALISDAIYGSTTAIQKSSLTNRFNGTALEDWEYVARNNETTDGQFWSELYFPTVNMTVLAVRGTASATDALEDMHFWFGITIMQAVNVFVPFLKQLPRAFVVKMLSMNLISSVMPAPVFTDLVNHAIDTRARVGNRLVLTGHSLGGAIAAMVGAKTKTRAVSFSGPGLLYSLGRFDITAKDVRDYVLTMKPNKDIVPEVDELGGLVQEIRCKHSSPMSCHSTNTHLCELYFSCGDPRNRNWTTNTQCIEYDNLADDETSED